MALNEADVIDEQAAVNWGESTDLENNGVKLRHGFELIWVEVDTVLFPVGADFVERDAVEGYPVVDVC